jgi:hypothetical protein
MFEKAVSAWWIGRKDESVEIFNKLDAMYLEPGYRQAVKNNIERIANASV